MVSPLPDPSLSPTLHTSICNNYILHARTIRLARWCRETHQSLPWGCTLGQPVRQASSLACEGSACNPKRERKKDLPLLHGITGSILECNPWGCRPHTKSTLSVLYGTIRQKMGKVEKTP